MEVVRLVDMHAVVAVAGVGTGRWAGVADRPGSGEVPLAEVVKEEPIRISTSGSAAVIVSSLPSLSSLSVVHRTAGSGVDGFRWAEVVEEVLLKL